MSKLSFTALKELCDHNLDKRHIQEINETIKSECLFHPGIVMSAIDFANLYKTRFELAKNKGLNKDYLNDFELVVSQLLNSQSAELALVTLYNDQFGFIVFYEPLTQTVLGVLKSQNQLGLRGIEKHNDEKVRQGISSGFQKYFQAELIQEWK